jgi:hypothetical protein
MFGIFKSKERRQADQLAALATRTIDTMDRLLSDGTCSLEDRKLILSHRERRHGQLVQFQKFADGRVDDLDRLASPVQSLRYEIFRESMENELRHFSNGPAQLASYIRQIRAP